MSEDCCAYLRDICLILACSNKSIFEIDSYRFYMKLTCSIDYRTISVPFDWLKFPFLRACPFINVHVSFDGIRYVTKVRL